MPKISSSSFRKSWNAVDMVVEHKTEVKKLNDRIDVLERENDGLRKDNRLLLDDKTYHY